MLIYALAFVLFVSSCYAQDGCGSTTPDPQQQDVCRRDIIIGIDGTNYMKNNYSVIQEIDFIDKMISNWTWGDNGVNVAIVSYGFFGQFSFNNFFPNLSAAKQVLVSLRQMASFGVFQPTNLTAVVQFVDTTYTSTYPHRPGVEPRFICFTATDDTNDIANAAVYFKSLYDKNYDTLINVMFSDPQLFKNVEALKVIDMKNFAPQYYQNITETIWSTLCVHDIRFTPLPCTTTTTPIQSVKTTTTTYAPVPTTTTTLTKSPTTTTTQELPLTTTTSGGGIGPGGNSGEGGCRCVTQHLWLDIVIVMDASQSIRQEGLGELQGHIYTLFGEYMTIDPLKTQTVRIAIVSTAERAQVEAHFHQIKSMDDLQYYLYGVTWKKEQDTINIEQALQNASTILLNEGPQRKNVKKVIIVYTSAFDLDGVSNPVAVATSLKASGVTIIGVKYNIIDETPFNANLSLITSPNMTFSNRYILNPFNSNLLNITVEALCWVNCFCINKWNERKNPFTTLPKYGQCFYPADIDSGWTPARHSCLDMTTGSSMSFAKTQDKFEYYMEMLANQTTGGKKMNFHVGIYYNQSLNSYQYVDGSLPISADFLPWYTGYPKLTYGSCVAAKQISGFNVSYVNIDCYNFYARYVCEVIPCDTENYCATIDDF
uniref:VWFA domain-containing protein n=1 Tax=Panagrolaimus sp. ES5 TaxID=591445 RepID=A0AC34F0U3_9BILA